MVLILVQVLSPQLSAIGCVCTYIVRSSVTIIGTLTCEVLVPLVHVSMLQADQVGMHSARCPSWQWITSYRFVVKCVSDIFWLCERWKYTFLYLSLYLGMNDFFLASLETFHFIFSHLLLILPLRNQWLFMSIIVR